MIQKLLPFAIRDNLLNVVGEALTAGKLRRSSTFHHRSKKTFDRPRVQYDDYATPYDGDPEKALMGRGIYATDEIAEQTTPAAHIWEEPENLDVWYGDKHHYGYASPFAKEVESSVEPSYNKHAHPIYKYARERIPTKKVHPEWDIIPDRDNLFDRDLNSPGGLTDEELWSQIDQFFMPLVNPDTGLPEAASVGTLVSQTRDLINNRTRLDWEHKGKNFVFEDLPVSARHIYQDVFDADIVKHNTPQHPHRAIYKNEHWIPTNSNWIDPEMTKAELQELVNEQLGDHVSVDDLIEEIVRMSRG